MHSERKMQKLLYDRYAPQMYTVCLRYSKNVQDAEDNLQEGFLKVFKKIGTYRGDGPFKSWVAKIFIFTCLGSYKSLNSNRHFVDKETVEIGERGITGLDKLREKEIMQLIQNLPAGYRVVFNMYILENYSHKDISEILGIHVGTSKSQLARAKKILREQV